MKPRLYVETSIVSYLTARPSGNALVFSRQNLTKYWWMYCRDSFDIHVSELVVEESESGDTGAAQRRIDAIGNIPSLVFTEEARALADEIVAAGLIPGGFTEDALHIALCAIHEMDYLLTWNCKHLANAVMRRRIERLISRHGYNCPVICTPEEIMNDETV